MSARSFSKKKTKVKSVQSVSTPAPVRSKGRLDVYTVMTVLAFVGMLAGTVLVYLESAKFAG